MTENTQVGRGRLGICAVNAPASVYRKPLSPSAARQHCNPYQLQEGWTHQLLRGQPKGCQRPRQLSLLAHQAGGLAVRLHQVPFQVVDVVTHLGRSVGWSVGRLVGALWVSGLVWQLLLCLLRQCLVVWEVQQY